MSVKATNVLAASQFNKSSASGKSTVTIANPLDKDYLGIGPAGTKLGGKKPDGSDAIGSDCVLSVQPGGDIEVRVKGTDAGYEQCVRANGFATFNPDGKSCFQIPCE